MKTIQSLSRRAAALVLAVLLAVPTVYASAGERRLQTSIELVDGLTYRNTLTTGEGMMAETPLQKKAPAALRASPWSWSRTVSATPSSFRAPGPYTAPPRSTRR